MQIAKLHSTIAKLHSTISKLQNFQTAHNIAVLHACNILNCM